MMLASTLCLLSVLTGLRCIRCLGTFGQLGFCVEKGQASYADNGGMIIPCARQVSHLFRHSDFDVQVSAAATPLLTATSLLAPQRNVPLPRSRAHQIAPATALQSAKDHSQMPQLLNLLLARLNHQQLRL